MNQRKKTILIFALALLFLTSVTLSGIFCYGGARKTDFSVKNLAPCLRYPFGTDWMGRNMLAPYLQTVHEHPHRPVHRRDQRAACPDSGNHVRRSWEKGGCGDFLPDRYDYGNPHILLLLLISYAFGKGFKGVVLGVALTHWPSLARVIRGEVMQLKESEYIQIAAKLGQSRLQIAWRHMVVHLFPQFVVG